MMNGAPGSKEEEKKNECTHHRKHADKKMFSPLSIPFHSSNSPHHHQGHVSQIKTFIFLTRTRLWGSE
uniref:Uncharacterized protein n=1 Tax=Trypanosoma brucei TaxID=5691 RepID=Q581H5_9TRYP|nr:hypothetical protein, unlikely [Trypanosoma brucei]